MQDGFQKGASAEELREIYLFIGIVDNRLTLCIPPEENGLDKGEAFDESDLFTLVHDQEVNWNEYDAFAGALAAIHFINSCLHRPNTTRANDWDELMQTVQSYCTQFFDEFVERYDAPAYNALIPQHALG